MKLTRTFRTMTSERFLVQKKEGQGSAAIDLHYLADGHVAGTVFLFEHAGIEDAEVPGFLRQIDEALLPWVHLENRTLTFTVVRGHVVGNSSPTRGRRERAREREVMLKKTLFFGLRHPAATHQSLTDGLWLARLPGL